MLGRNNSTLATVALVVALLLGEASRCIAEEVEKRPAIYGTPANGLDEVQTRHSDAHPIVVSQGELDKLIDADGGGACPISAALIALQGIRAMASMPFDTQPHRTALRVFTEKPELKKGRISNKGVVDLLAYLCQDLEGKPVSITTVSAPNSQHAISGTKWSDSTGPDLSTRRGELKILAYTVKTSDGAIRGRHFVILKEFLNGKMSFVNPGSPTKKRFFIVEYRGATLASKQRVFFHSPAGIDKSNQTYELNTVFTIRLIGEKMIAPEFRGTSNALSSIKSKIDQLAEELRQRKQFHSPVAWRRGGASFGLPGLDLPKDVGGGGWSTSATVEVFRHAGRHNLNLRDVVGGAHGRPLSKSRSPIAKDVLRDVIDGEAYIAVAITERGAGTDMKQMKSRAVRSGSGFKLTGRKLWNARLREATHVVIYTLAANGVAGERSAFLIPINHPGLRIVDRYAHGLTGNSFGGLEFDDMFVSSEHLLGEDGDGGKIFAEHFQYWRLMQAASAIGCGESALDQMAKRIQDRHAFGGPIGRFTHLQQPLGEYSTKLKMAMALTREAAALIDDGEYESAAPLVNGIKAEGVETALAACDAAMRAHGAMGYSRNVDLGDRVRDLMGLRIADGTTDVMRMSVVKETYGTPLWVMAVYGNHDKPESAKTKDENATAPSEPIESQ